MRVLDLYCGGGGATLGYLEFGFDVVGVDMVDQVNYPGTFVHSDAIEYVRAHGAEFDFIHASPPCQDHSKLTWGNRARGKIDGHLSLISATRMELRRTNRPWVMENVPTAPLRRDLRLCGKMFGLCSYRHRIFETNLAIKQPPHPPHTEPVWYPYDKRKATYGQPYHKGWAIPVHGDNNCPPEFQYLAMGVPPHQMSRAALIQAIPPAFTYYIAQQWVLGARRKRK